MKKIKLSLFIAALIFELSALSFQLSYAQSPECPLLDARELMEKIKSGERLVIVDVRSPSQYKQGHIPGSISIPGRETRERLPLETNKRDKVVIVGVDGEFAWITCRNMKANDYLVVHSLKGGMNSWEGPLEK